MRRCDASSTRLAYKRELVRFLAWLPAEPADELLFDYRDHLRDRHLGPTNVRWRTTVVRLFLRFACRRQYIDECLVGDFAPPKGKSGFAPIVLSQQELSRLLNAPDRRTRQGKRDALILMVLGIGGLRVGEVCRMNINDVATVDGHADLYVLGKRKRERLVRIPCAADLVRSYLIAWPEVGASSPLFLGGQPGRESKRITVSGIRYLVSRHGHSSCLSSISPHMLRHTSATLGIEAGEPLYNVRERLGHSSIVVTERYLHI